MSVIENVKEILEQIDKADQLRCAASTLHKTAKSIEADAHRRLGRIAKQNNLLARRDIHGQILINMGDSIVAFNVSNDADNSAFNIRVEPTFVEGRD